MAPRKGQGGARPAKAAPGIAATDPAVRAGSAVADLPAGYNRYPVLSPLRFDGWRYAPDDPEADVVTMTPDQAEPLRTMTVLGDALD